MGGKQDKTGGEQLADGADERAAPGDEVVEAEVGETVEAEVAETVEAEVAETVEAEVAETVEAEGEHWAGLLEDARAKADDHWDRILRLQAEMENLRRRSSRDLEQAHKFALEKFVGELLAVKDSLELGMSASNEATSVESLREGMSMTVAMLAGVFEKFQVTEINPDGEAFDPEFHQAMSMQATAEVSPGTVMTVVQKGYLLNERLIRPAMVVVAKASEEEA